MSEGEQDALLDRIEKRQRRYGWRFYAAVAVMGLVAAAGVLMVAH